MLFIIQKNKETHEWVSSQTMVAHRSFRDYYHILGIVLSSSIFENVFCNGHLYSNSLSAERHVLLAVPSQRFIELSFLEVGP